jgi:hypothetical protein
VDRRIEIEQLRRSIAMLSPEANALKREDALRLLHELGDVQARLENLKSELRRLAVEG